MMLSAEQLEVVTGLVSRARHTYPEQARTPRQDFRFALGRAREGGACLAVLPVADPRSELPVSIEIRVSRDGHCEDDFLTSVEQAIRATEPERAAA